MPEQFNAEEALAIAVEIEQNGQAFYRRAAETVSDENAKKNLLLLADWEKTHEKTFAEMLDRARSGGEEWRLDTDDEAGKYLRAVADGKIFPVGAAAANDTADFESLERILQVALGKEKDSVIFYLAMEAAANEAWRKTIHEIVREEMSHVRMLSGDLAALRKG